MAHKCRICGYRFKPGDGSLCPECFTARDDELTFDIRGSQKEDIFGSKRKEQLGSFLADEMREELHEDIAMKKNLDREDAAKTRNFTAQGANVKNESFKQAYQERKSRDTTTPGRVYSSNDTAKSAAKQNGSADPAVNSFLDSIDPTLRQRIYGGAQQQDQSKLRYYHHNSFQDLTSNQEMLYGLDAGKAPDDPARQAHIQAQINNFRNTNQAKYSKGSNSKAAIVVVISIIIFFFITIAMEEIGETREDAKERESKSISSVDVSKIDSSKARQAEYESRLSMKYGGGVMTLSNYSTGKTGIDAYNDKKYTGSFYPIEGYNSHDEKYKELMFEFTIKNNSAENDLPKLSSMTLSTYNLDSGACYCIGYDDIQSESKDNAGEYTLLITFIVPEDSKVFDLNVKYSSKQYPAGFSSLERFSLDDISKLNGKKNDGSSKAS